MALFNYTRDFKSDETDFIELYERGYEDFINSYSDNIVIDINDKIVVSVESGWDEKNFPVNILAMLIPEGEKYNYNATLIYSGHIAFIKIEYTSGKKKYFYKDDECVPQDSDELLENESSIFYEAKENGFINDDVFKYIEDKIKVDFNYKFKLEKEKLVFLEGL